MPGTTNFQQWNPTGANQENDAAYTADAQRLGGAPVNAIWPSPTANKALYQFSTFITAFGQMMAAKGYNTSDANLAALVAALANVQTAADAAPTFRSGVAIVHTGTVTNDTVWSAAIPALGAASLIRVRFTVKPNAQGGAGTTISLTWGGSSGAVANWNSAGYNGFELNFDLTLYCRGTHAQFLAISVNNNPSLNVIGQIVSGGSGGFTEDLSVPVTLSIKVQNGTITDSQTFEAALIQVII